MEPATLNDLILLLIGNFHKYLLDAGVGPEFLANKLKAGCEATKTTRLKVKGYINTKPSLFVKQHKLPENCKIISANSKETVLEFVNDDGARQDRNRMDAEKIFNLYPKQQHVYEVEGVSTLVAEVMDEIDGNDRGVLPADQLGD